MKSICAEVGMSPGTLYHYFASKSDIVAGIIRREEAVVADLFGELDKSGDVITGLFMVIDLIAQGVTDEELVLHAEIAAEILRNPSLREQARRAEAAASQKLAVRLEQAQAAGAVDAGLDSEAAAAVINALIDGLIWRASLHDRAAIVSLLPNLKQAIARMLIDPEAADRCA